MANLFQGEEWNELTDDEKSEYSFYMLCNRLMDIDPVCGEGKGCPTSFAAIPMIDAWRVGSKGRLTPESIVKCLLRFDYAISGSDGRACEFGEIRLHAQEFIDNYLVKVNKTV